MSPKLQALKDALAAMDAGSPYSFSHDCARKEMLRCARAAGFNPQRAAEDWARYTVAVGEVADEGEFEAGPEQEAFL